MWRKKPQECSFFSFLFMCWVFPVLWRKPWSNGQLKIIVILIIYCAMPLQKPRAFLKDSLVASCWNTLKLDSVGIVNCQGNLSDTRSKEQRPARSLMRLHVLHFISPPTCFVLSYLCEIMFRRGFCHLWLRFVMFPLDPVENIQVQPTPVLLPGKSQAWTEEPDRLQSVGSRRVRHNRATSLSLFTFMHWRRKWHPTPVFLPGDSQGWRSLVGSHLWGRTESDTTEVT